MEGRDIPAVVSLDRQVFEDPWPESAYVQEIYFNPNAHYFVLELLDLQQARAAEGRSWISYRRRPASRIVGFVGMRVERACGHISTLAIRPDWRGQRLGEALLLLAVEQAIEDGARTLTLEVRVSNEVALRLYGKWGFAPRSQLHRYYANGEDAYLMQVDLYEDPAYCARVEAQLTALLGDLEVQPARSAVDSR
jgi:[ribosomal protein S18]-alanine N-acetyltransferase